MKKILLVLILCSVPIFPQNFWELGLLFSEETPVYALDLNGSNENMTIAGVSLGTNFSVLAWAKLDATPAQYNAICGNTTGDSYPILLKGDTYNIYTHDGTSATFVASTNAMINQWHLYAIVRDGTSVKFYQDGVQVQTDKTLGSNNAVTVTQIATRKGQFFFKGLLGELQILTGSLTPSEVADISSTYSTATIQMWYKWQGNTDADMLKDYSGNNRNLTGNNVTTADQVKISGGYK